MYIGFSTGVNERYFQLSVLPVQENGICKMKHEMFYLLDFKHDN